MCLRTNWLMPRITLRPIECYKILSVDDFGRVLTPYQDYPVTFDKTLRDRAKTTRFKIRGRHRNEGRYAIESGMFHCYSSLVDARHQAKVLHVIARIGTNSTNTSYIIAHATIPRFTRYYRSSNVDWQTLCAKRIKYSSNDIIEVQLPEVPEE